MAPYRPPVRVRPSLQRTGATVARPAAEQKTAAPISPFDLAAIVKMVEELKDMHSKVLDAQVHAGTMEDLKKMHQETLAKGEQIFASIGKVKQGNPGNPGKAAQEVNLDEVARRAAALIPAPKDGKDAEPIDEKKIAKRAAKLVKISMPDVAPQDKIDPADIVAQVAELVRNGGVKIPLSMVEGLDGKFTEIHSRIPVEVEQYGKNTWKRGGGDTVKAGNNVTITTNADGQKIINAVTGGLTPIVVTGTVDDSNKSFNAATQPSLLNINGAFYLKTGGAYTWTYVGTTITLNQPVGTGGSIFGI